MTAGARARATTPRSRPRSLRPRGLGRCPVRGTERCSTERRGGGRLGTGHGASGRSTARGRSPPTTGGTVRCQADTVEPIPGTAASGRGRGRLPRAHLRGAPGPVGPPEPRATSRRVGPRRPTPQPPPTSLRARRRLPTRLRPSLRPARSAPAYRTALRTSPRKASQSGATSSRPPRPRALRWRLARCRREARLRARGRAQPLRSPRYRQTRPHRTGPRWTTTRRRTGPMVGRCRPVPRGGGRSAVGRRSGSSADVGVRPSGRFRCSSRWRC